MVNKTTGAAWTRNYRIQVGEDDKLKKRRVNTYRNSVARVTNSGGVPYEKGLGFVQDIAQIQPATFFPKAYNEIQYRLKNNLLNEFDSNLILADFYYAKSTISTAVQQAQKALRVTRALKRGDIRAVRAYFNKRNSNYGRKRTGKRRYHNALPELPAAWLQWQFVVQPLVITMRSLAKHLDDPWAWQDILIRSGMAEQTVVEQFVGEYRKTYVAQCTGRYYAQARIDNPNTDFLSRAGAYDIIMTVHDIMPWTWAVDYFTTTGNVLKQLNPRYDNYTLKNESMGLGCRMTLDVIFRWRNSQSEPFRVVERSIEGYRFDRVRGKPAPITWQFRNELTLTRLANLLSAIAMSLKDEKREWRPRK